jgi:hypothetical protein
MTSTTQNVGAGLAPALHPQPCINMSQTPHPFSNIIEQFPPYSPQFTERPQTPHPFPNIIEQFPPYSPQFTERPQTPHPFPKQYGAICSLFAPN